jgi:hypothetical protein
MGETKQSCNDYESTVDLMLSDDYRERFIAEYMQLTIRMTKLEKFCNRIEAAIVKGTEEPKHDCPLNLLKDQLHAMRSYLVILQLRAEIEGIDLG